MRKVPWGRARPSHRIPSGRRPGSPALVDGTTDREHAHPVRGDPAIGFHLRQPRRVFVSRRLAVVCRSSVSLSGCGSASPTAPTLRTESFPAFTITDPTACNCGNGIAQYKIDVAAAGPLEATASWTPSDATVIVRLLD